MTEKDWEDLDFILTPAGQLDRLVVCAPRRGFVRTQRKNRSRRTPAKVMAKIEKPEAVKNIREIIRTANGIMVARGDLGVETDLERLPITKKKSYNCACSLPTPVIVTTKMMDSMITNPSPTRAEVTDVANAVLDGADAVMLSGETS